jgi:hypothetical protein
VTRELRVTSCQTVDVGCLQTSLAASPVRETNRLGCFARTSLTVSMFAPIPGYHAAATRQRHQLEANRDPGGLGYVDRSKRDHGLAAGRLGLHRVQGGGHFLQGYTSDWRGDDASLSDGFCHTLEELAGHL